MKRTSFFFAIVIALSFFYSCLNSKKTEDLIPVQSFFFLHNSIVEKVYYDKERLPYNGPNNEYCYKTVLKTEKYSKEYIRKHPELLDAFLRSLAYSGLFVAKNGKIEEVDDVFIIESNVSAFSLAGEDSLRRIHLDVNEIPEQLFKKGAGMFVLKNRGKVSSESF